MMQLEFGGARIPVPAGETIIGSAPGCAIVLEGEGVQPRHAVLQGTPQGAAAIRAGDPGAELIVNGIRLGADPTPVLHGDKIQIGPHEILAVDSRRVGNTQLFDSGAFTDLVPAPRPSGPAAPAGPTGGRVVCLTDGREYLITGQTLVFGRDAGSDVVVGGTEVSRHHAEIQVTPGGYVLADLSVNGTYVNGERMGRVHPLARADVIRIGHDEFRFYADAAPPPQPRGRRSVPPVTAAQPPTGAGARLSDTLHGVPQSSLAGAVTPTTPTAAPLASLLVRSGTLKGRRLPVKAAVTNIGRADFNDVVIADPSVSTSHARLQRRDDVWVLSDLSSTNGTFVEGEPLTGDMALAPGMTVRFGEVSVLFEPFDDVASSRRPSDTEAASGRLPAEEPAADGSAARPRRPIRVTPPRPSGPPAWLIALLVIAAAVAAFLLLR
ncbi:MAG TPA: FHA domain-containing protein [Gemmatimonadales bacterium]|jgi:pSer/pThr/pTyr-binding forkhead associated (FHA) protein|nr:FHA domain-containing protein [Gemmatimonadales bacterium]